MDRSLTDLSDRFRPLAEALLKAFADAGLNVIVVDTLRTPAEQADALASGHSWTQHSKHLTGDAIDVAPLQEWTKNINWSPSNPDWQRMGEIGEGLGLRWGGRWAHADLGHFEYVES
jgi:peptidoglycan L-alanyl-D-glutamate endopeptidase CwlK